MYRPCRFRILRNTKVGNAASKTWFVLDLCIFCKPTCHCVSMAYTCRSAIFCFLVGVSADLLRKQPSNANHSWRIHISNFRCILCGRKLGHAGPYPERVRPLESVGSSRRRETSPAHRGSTKYQRKGVGCVSHLP